MVFRSCITALTAILFNRLIQFSDDQCGQEAQQYLDTIHPFRPIETGADHQISRESQFDLQIIMPAYNVEKYIQRSIESVIGQHTKYSCLLVVINDGSTDRTPIILEHYEKYPNVHIINQENSGVACARNRGLENILGRYIMFLDPDDYLCAGAVETLLDRACQADLDIVEGNAYFLYNDRLLIRKKMHCGNGNAAGADLRGEPWGKVIKAEIFKDIQFPEGYYFEDTIFAYCIYPKLISKYAISDFVYVYRKNPMGTSIRSKKEIKAVDTYYIMGYMWEQYGSRRADDATIQKKALGHLVLCFKRCKRLGHSITKMGFVYLADIYRKVFQECAGLTGRYALMDRCVRVRSYKGYRLLCSNWKFME